MLVVVKETPSIFPAMLIPMPTILDQDLSTVPFIDIASPSERFQNVENIIGIHLSARPSADTLP